MFGEEVTCVKINTFYEGTPLLALRSSSAHCCPLFQGVLMKYTGQGDTDNLCLTLKGGSNEDKLGKKGKM